MASLLFIRLVWGFWWASTLYLIGASLSGWVFSKDTARHKRFVQALFASLVWPLMVLSPKGRAQLLKIMKGTL